MRAWPRIALAGLVLFGVGAGVAGSSAPKLRNIALGDSFSPGEGVSALPARDGELLPVPNQCHRYVPRLPGADRGPPELAGDAEVLGLQRCADHGHGQDDQREPRRDRATHASIRDYAARASAGQKVTYLAPTGF